MLLSFVEASLLYIEGPFVLFRGPLFVQEVGMLGTKPLSNKSFHPEPLRRIIHSIAYHFRGWHRGNKSPRVVI